ncbi:MAG: hypothetical protein K2M94_00355 [Paramuribaculum sp.]|nr:hypothetical protein [Paramuribaculum sp.]
MFWFWFGISVFGIGVLVRCYSAIRYYKEYKTNAHTDVQKQELTVKYRSLRFISIALQAAGCIISYISMLN